VQVENIEKTEIETIFLHNLIVKHIVICHEKPELQATAGKLAPMYFKRNIFYCLQKHHM